MSRRRAQVTNPRSVTCGGVSNQGCSLGSACGEQASGRAGEPGSEALSPKEQWSKSKRSAGQVLPNCGCPFPPQALRARAGRGHQHLPGWLALLLRWQGGQAPHAEGVISGLRNTGNRRTGSCPLSHYSVTALSMRPSYRRPGGAANRPPCAVRPGLERRK